jgi:hypothetical protein
MPAALSTALAAQEELRELPLPTWAFGLGAFLALLALLLMTLAFGKGRPHS